MASSVGGGAARFSIVFALVAACFTGCTVDDGFSYAKGGAAGSSTQGGSSSGSGGVGGRASGGSPTSAGSSSKGGASANGGADSGGADNAGGDAQGGDAGNDPPTCPAGTHLCAAECVDDTDVRTCGASCSACEPPIDGFATCDGTQCGAECGAGKKLCHSACIDAAAPCEGECPEGTHDCAGFCASDTSVNTCGAACEPCFVPGGATQASCDGVSCDFQCSPGTHACGSQCVEDSDVTACGSTCTVCPKDPQGTAQCISGVCAIACKSGYHLCDGACVADTSPLTCGESCEPCTVPTGGTATCVAGTCGATCPANMKLCAGACIPQNSACAGTCPTETHDCDGVCVPDTSTTQCGAECVSCPRPEGSSEASCSEGVCNFTCTSGYHRCGSRCVRDDDATACGSACVDCADDANGTALCQSGACALRCATGYHLCNNRCVSNNALATCGTTASACSPCVAPTGGTVTCDGVACVPACPNGTKLCESACIPNANACAGVCPKDSHNCSGICKSNNSTASCGNSCAACIPPVNANPTCNGTTCGFTCKPGFTGTNCGWPRLQAMPLDAGAISDDGTIVIGGTLRWVVGSATPAGLTGVPAPYYAYGISGNGLVVVGSVGDQTFSWSAQGTQLLPLPSADFYFYPTATSYDGTMIVGRGSDSVDFAFYWPPPSTAYSVFPNPALFDETFVYGVSADGAIAGGSGRLFNGESTPVWYTRTSINVLPSTVSAIRVVSGDGTVLAGGGSTAVRFSGPGYTTSLPLGGLASSGLVYCLPRGISTDGSTIVGYCNVSSTSGEATLWNSTGAVQKISDILTAAGANLTGWTLLGANDVSANGKVVIGRGTLNGDATSWLARLP